MRKFIIISLILFFSLTSFQSYTFSRQSDIAKIRKEMDHINQLTFKKIEIDLGAAGWTIYVDKKKRIRKLIYLFNSPATDAT